MTQRDGRFRTVVFTIFALLAFAANSLLCRGGTRRAQHRGDTGSSRTRLIVATVLIIGGVALTLMGRESTIASRGRGGRR